MPETIDNAAAMLDFPAMTSRRIKLASSKKAPLRG